LVALLATQQQNAVGLIARELRSQPASPATRWPSAAGSSCPAATAAGRLL